MSEKETPSVYSDKLKESIESIPQELYSLTEKSLRDRISPDIKMYELKRAFWEELWFAQENSRTMRVWRIYDGKVSKQYFYQDILPNREKMAWLTSPLTGYEDKTKAALDMVTERYNELIGMDITTTKRIKGNDGEWKTVTETDPKKALVLLQVIKNLEDRIKGTAIQRQVNVNTGSPSGQGAKSVALDMKAVEDRLAELEGEMGKTNIGENNGPARVQQNDAPSGERESRGVEGEDIIDTPFRVVGKKE